MCEFESRLRHHKEIKGVGFESQPLFCGIIFIGVICSWILPPPGLLIHPRQAIVKNVLTPVRNGSIVIFHDGDEKDRADRNREA